MTSSIIRSAISSRPSASAAIQLRKARACVPTSSTRIMHKSALKLDPNPIPRSTFSQPGNQEEAQPMETGDMGASTDSQDTKWEMFHATKRLDDEVAVVDQRMHSLDTKTHDTSQSIRNQLHRWVRCGIGAGVATVCLVLYGAEKNFRELDELEERLDRKHAALDIRIRHIENQQKHNGLRVD